MKEKKARVEDALHATRAAVEEGVVPGGGVALVRAINAIKTQNLKGDNHDQDVGIQIALRAMEEPLRLIVSNAGVEGSVVFQGFRVQGGQPRLQRRDRRVRRHDEDGHPRPDQGDPHRAAERGLHCRAHDYDRGHGGRAAEGRSPGRWRWSMGGMGGMGGMDM